jgi:hypothetical protein
MLASRSLTKNTQGETGFGLFYGMAGSLEPLFPSEEVKG